MWEGLDIRFLYDEQCTREECNLSRLIMHLVEKEAEDGNPCLEWFTLTRPKLLPFLSVTLFKTGLLTKFGAETPPTETPNTSFLRTTSVKRTLDIPQLFSFLPFACNAVLILPAKQCLLFFFLSKFAELPNHNFINLISLLPTVTRAIFSCLLIPMNSYYL